MNALKIKQYNPKYLLAIYGTAVDDAYIEKHQIDSSGQVLSGRPLNVNELRSLGQALVQHSKPKTIRFSGLIPSNVIIYNNDDNGLTLGWVVRSKKSQMCFTRDLQIPDGTAYQPDMLFLIRGGCYLSVFWLKSPKVTNETTLYVAPYHNVSDKGSVCLGTVSRNFQGDAEDLMDFYETAFFHSRFSHANEAICSVINFNLNDFWKDRINTDKKFTDADFIKSTVTIDSLIYE